MNKYINQKIHNEINSIVNKLTDLKLQKNSLFTKLCLETIRALKKGNKIIFFGNGGSAADAQHLATEITVRYKKNRPALGAISLSTDTSALTAIGNDLNFKFIFSRQIEAIANKKDIILGITTSGNSRNIIEAFKVSKKLKIKSYCFVGNNGGNVKKYCNNCIIFPKTSTSATQVMQITLGQILCEIIEDKIYK